MSGLASRVVQNSVYDSNLVLFYWACLARRGPQGEQVLQADSNTLYAAFQDFADWQRSKETGRQSGTNCMNY
jgi:hypothetical protein